MKAYWKISTLAVMALMLLFAGAAHAQDSAVYGAWPFLPKGCTDGQGAIYNATTRKWDCGSVGGGGGGGGTPGGSNGQLQYRVDASTFGGLPLSWNGTLLTFPGSRVRVDASGNLEAIDSNFLLYSGSTIPIGIGSATQQGSVSVRGGNTLSAAGITVGSLIRANTTNQPGAVAGLIAPAATVRGFLIQGAASQSANLFEFRDSANNFLTGFDPAGNFSGKAGTADALAANPADCGSNLFANAIGANGALSCIAVDWTQVANKPATFGAVACPATFDGTNDPDELDGTAAGLTYAANLQVLFTSDENLAGPTVLDCGGGLKPVYMQSDGHEIVADDIPAGHSVLAVYEPTWNAAAGAWHVLSPSASPYRKLSDAPQLHAATHAAGQPDAVTPAAIGAAPLLTGANPAALSIVSGAVTVGSSGGNNTIDTESDAASDDLTTLNCTANTMFLLKPESDARTVVLKANLAIGIEADRPMDQDGDHALFFCPAANAPVLLAFIDEDDVVYANGFAIGAPGGPSLAELLKFDFVFPFSNGGSVLAASQARWIDVPNGCVITEWIVEAQPAGSSVVFDVWMDAGANFPPTIADTIVASAKPTLSSGVRATSTTLTGWTTQTVENNVLMAVVESATTATNASLRLRCTIN